MGTTPTLTIFASPGASALAAVPAATASVRAPALASSAAAAAVAAALAPSAAAAAVAPALWAAAAPRMPIDVPVKIVSKSFAQLLDQLGEVFNTAAKKTFGGMRLQEVEVSLDVSAEGKVGILGTGSSVTGTTGLKLTFKRSDGDGFAVS